MSRGDLLLALFLCGVVAAVIAQSKRSEPLRGFVMGFFMGPIGIVLAALWRRDDGGDDVGS